MGRSVFCLIAALGLSAGRVTQAAQEEPAAETTTPACPDGICRGLGHGFFLPEINGFDPPSTGNNFFVDARLGSCASLSPPREAATRQFESTESMRELVRRTTAGFDLDASYTTARLTAKTSVSLRTGGDATTTERMTSANIDITTPTRNVDFNLRARDCFNKDNVDPADVKQFESLPLIAPERVNQRSAWVQYETYLRRSGSHIMVRQQLGSRFQQWESSNSSASDILNTLKAKACLAVEKKDATNKGWSVDGCADYSEEQRIKASQTNSQSRQIVLGGTHRTRVALTQGVTKESVDAFIASASRGDEPIRFGFRPIWELWIQIYSPLCKGDGSRDCGNLQRAYDLKTAYEGILAIGCPELKTSNGIVYQGMAQAGEPDASGIRHYGCFAERTGCRSNRDCRAGGAGSICYCYGPSCLGQGERIADTDRFRTRVIGRREGDYDQGVNNACRFSPGIGSTCSCNTSWSGGLPRRDLFEQSGPAQ
jgi:hypothetical protein